MKRYNIQTEYNRFACEDQLSVAEDPSGEWVKWNDVVDFMCGQLMKGANTQLQVELQKTLIEDLRKQKDDLHETINLLLTREEGYDKR